MSLCITVLYQTSCETTREWSAKGTKYDTNGVSSLCLSDHSLTQSHMHTTEIPSGVNVPKNDLLFVDFSVVS